MIKAIIVDDEPAMQEVNRNYLTTFFPEIEIAGLADSVESAIELIEKTDPQLVLLDIELNKGIGFEILQQLQPYNFKVVFISGYDTYALQAIKFSALDYILKPIDETEFRESIENALSEIKQENDQQLQTKNLLNSLRKEFQPKKLVLKTSDSLHLIHISDILYCQSENSYTTFYLKDDEKIIVSKSIKEFDEMLSDNGFFRPHQSFLVNLNQVKKIDKSDGGFIIMKNKKEIPISLRQKKKLIYVLENLM